MTALSARLRDLGACREAVEWVESLGDITAQDAWGRCERGDWMLWLVGHVAAGEPWSDQRRPLVLAAARCAELALPAYAALFPAYEPPAVAVRLALSWGSGSEVQRGDMEDAADDAAFAFAHAASAAAYAADDAACAAAAAAYAADDAACAASAAADDAACAASAAASAAAYAADAAAYAAYAAYAAAAYAADAEGRTTLLRCAEIVREVYPMVPKGLVGESDG